MIRFLTGDLLSADADALVNTVNTVGVMGKGIALQFKAAFPHNYEIYVRACRRQELVPGKLLTVWDTNPLYGRKRIINFPTKTHWRYPSKYEYIADGLLALKDLIENENISSIAIPALGAGNGGLEWGRVKQMIAGALANLPADIQVYQPGTSSQ